MSFATFMSHHARFISDAMKRIQDILLPSACLLCNEITQEIGQICFHCQQHLPILPDHCPQCANALPHTAPLTLTCGTCLKNPPPFSRTYALFPYETPIITLITALKFKAALSHANAFGEQLAQSIQKQWYVHQPLPDLIIPVPLHDKRLRERGFNQALEIAKPIAKRLRLPIDTHHLKRIQYTAAQSELPAHERKNNVAKAFVTDRDYSGLFIAVIDDVMTTGETLSACCRVLKQHGAKRIDVWCVARAL